MRTVRFWVAPVVGLIVAIVLATTSLIIDSALTWPTAPPPPLLAGSASTAGSLFSAIAGAVTSLLALVFTIITVVIQLATGQYSARALRTLYMDRPTHFTIGIFVTTITYSLMVLPSVKSEGDPLGVTVMLAVLLAVLSVVTFAIFAHHVAHLIRVGSLTAAMAGDTRSVIDREMPHPVSHETEAPAAPGPPKERPSQSVCTTTSGSLVDVDEEALLRAAQTIDGVIEVVPAIGDYLPEGATLFRIWGPDTSHDVLRQSVTLDVERTVDRDVAWGLRLLVDVCVRALSPGINDPTTAVQSLDRIHDLLRLLSTRAMPKTQWFDPEGELRVLTHSPNWEDFVALATDEVRQAGAQQLQVMRRLRALLLDIRDVAPSGRRPPLDRRLAVLDATIERTFEDEDDRRLAAQPDVQGIGGGFPTAYERDV